MYTVNRRGDLLWHQHRGYRDGGGSDTWSEPRIVGTHWDGFEHITYAENGIIYAIDVQGQLRWYRHDGHLTGEGIESWAPNSGAVVGVGWHGMLHLMAGPEGIVYAVDAEGVLRWYRHFGYLDGGGLNTWGANGYQVVGHEWGGFARLCWAGNGVIYAIASDGVLRWYEHLGYRTGGGLETWHPQDTGFQKVGVGWTEFSHVIVVPDS